MILAFFIFERLLILRYLIADNTYKDIAVTGVKLHESEQPFAKYINKRIGIQP